MDLKIHLSEIKNNQQVLISGSKSETNRLLLLKAQFPQLNLENASISDDSEVMIKALSLAKKSTTDCGQLTIDVGHAGTAMRFLTAYFAIQTNIEVVLTGSQRMQQRPIKILVDALRELGAKIDYVNHEGFPPLKIIGTKILKNEVRLKADISSQYISALLLIAPSLESGLKLTLDGEITSLPYIKMTLALLEKVGVQTSFLNNVIVVKPTIYNLQPVNVLVESDWSSASYFYSIVALSPIGTSLTLGEFKENSLQGDRHLVKLYEDFGIKTTFQKDRIKIEKDRESKEKIDFNLNQTPDLAQTIAVTAFALGCDCHLTGLQTLKIKETDRLIALQNELTKLGGKVEIDSDSLRISKSEITASKVIISTYDDHRMAMAFAPLALKKQLIIENAHVVNKSYPNFWDDLKSIGFLIE